MEQGQYSSPRTVGGTLCEELTIPPFPVYLHYWEGEGRAGKERMGEKCF